MQPSRELDELVAEHIMGWKKDNCDRWQVMDENFDTPNATFVQGWIAPKDQIYPHESVYKGRVSNYSEDIKDAFKVVDFLLTKDIRLELVPVRDEQPLYEATFLKMDNSEFKQWWPVSESKSAVAVSLAICEAALTIDKGVLNG